MILTSVEHWRVWLKQYTALPMVAVFSIENDRILSWKSAWEQAEGKSFVLESGKAGRYTFLGLDPVSVIRGKGMHGQITDNNGEQSEIQGLPVQLVKMWMAPFLSPQGERWPKFIGGCVGFWGYDVARSIERLPEHAHDDLSLPDYCFMRFDRIWVIDQAEQKLYCAVHLMVSGENIPDEEKLKQQYRQAEEAVWNMKRQWDDIVEHNARIETLQSHQTRVDRLAKESPSVDSETISGLQRSFTKEGFIDAVERVKQYITAGDLFQANLSVRQSSALTAEPEDIYEWLRLVNPSPYMGYLQFGDFQFVSASPELLVQLEGKKVRTRPIAGTRPRGETDEQDLMLARELIDNDKERAEHIMLVDLERNDLGKVCSYGTVKVAELMAIERYSHVMHIVSEVEGEIADGYDAYDVITAAFPGGTITGAPKIRTMEIIEELEPVRRGPYTGSIGWIDYNGNMEMNIVIRTLVSLQGVGHVQAGAGIVIDSDPEKEYVESLNKAKALWKAIQLAEGSR